jgi:hypothetical protein
MDSVGDTWQCQQYLLSNSTYDHSSSRQKENKELAFQEIRCTKKGGKKIQKQKQNKKKIYI